MATGDLVVSAPVVGPAPFVTIELAAKITGYSELAIERKIERGVWRQGLEWFKAPDGRRLINLKGYEEWAKSTA